MAKIVIEYFDNNGLIKVTFDYHKDYEKLLAEASVLEDYMKRFGNIKKITVKGFLKPTVITFDDAWIKIYEN